MKQTAIFILLFISVISSIQAQERRMTTTPANDDVNLEKKRKDKMKFALVDKNETVLNAKTPVFKDYADLSNHTLYTFPNREEYIKTVHLKNYIKSDLK